MPNYTWNRIKADKDVISGLLDENGDFTFEKFIPCPEELTLTTAGGRVDELVCLYILENFKYKDIKENPAKYFNGFANYYVDLNKTKKANIAKLKEILNGKTVDVITDGWGPDAKVLREVTGEEYFNLQQKYGFHNWYDYHNEKWGTKWDAFEVGIGNDEIAFTTAWAAPFPIFEKICAMFPKKEIEFEAEYEDNYFIAGANYYGKFNITEEHEMEYEDEEDEEEIYT